MITEANLILTDYGEFGWGITSPELPGLIGGAGSRDNLVRMSFDMAVAAGLSRDGSAHLYFQYAISVDSAIYYIRAKNDAYLEQRRELGARAIRSIKANPDCRDYIAKDELGDGTVVVTLPGDLVNEAAETFTVNVPATIVSAHNEGLAFFNLARVNESFDGAKFDLHDAREGLDDGVTIRELLEYAGAAECSSSRDLILV